MFESEHAVSLCHAIIAWAILFALCACGLCCIGGCGGEVRIVTPRVPGKPVGGPIAVGDRVRVRSGGPVMIVRRIRCRANGCEAYCEWFGIANPRGAWFGLDVLQRE